MAKSNCQSFRSPRVNKSPVLLVVSLASLVVPARPSHQLVVEINWNADVRRWSARRSDSAAAARPSAVRGCRASARHIPPRATSAANRANGLLQQNLRQDERSGTITQTLLRRALAQHQHARIIHRGGAWASTLNSRSQRCQSFSPSSAFFAAGPPPALHRRPALILLQELRHQRRYWSMSSLHTTSIFRVTVRVDAGEIGFQFFSAFDSPARMITRWPSAQSVGLPSASHSALNSSGSALQFPCADPAPAISPAAAIAVFRSKSVMMCGKNRLRLFCHCPRRYTAWRKIQLQKTPPLGRGNQA